MIVDIDYIISGKGFRLERCPCRPRWLRYLLTVTLTNRPGTSDFVLSHFQNHHLPRNPAQCGKDRKEHEQIDEMTKKY